MSVTINGTTGIDKITDGSVVQADLANGVTSTGPAFSAYSTTNQSISANTATKIQYNNKAFDLTSDYDTSNYRFTPSVSGYYQVNALITFAGTAAQYTVIAMSKNGSQIYIANIQRSNGNYNCVTLSDVVYMNGTTDYLEIYGYEQSNTTTISSATQSRFSATLVRAA